MFPEYRELIGKLKESHPRFRALFDKHNRLDHDIARLEQSDGRGYDEHVAAMKKEKLKIKDELYRLLKEEDNNLA
ncbi:YdcH family protein [Apirhabdus apintestini]|uniref:YdcH family protein n=1 Tax=Erwinia sp. HR93 TaxID=3094840 RepID=UPI002ADEBF84|nr:YdcH family protein [Erwinia sp. HR93]MEA1065009.1 YdcH family protein [Erwinia sp. HR93]WPM85778.1 YdcH family protein [Enterobacteriaceae bacterium CA-0114]